MVELANAVIFLSLTLIAVVVAVFTIAVSFLGRALQQARADQQKAAEEDKKAALERLEQLKKNIGKVQSKLEREDAKQAIVELKKQLREYEKEEKQAEKDSKRIAPKYRTYRLLTVPGGVLPSSLWLLGSFSLAAVTQLFTTSIGYAPLGVSVVALGWACFRIYRSLKVVQEIAVITEEAQFKRQTEALADALERHEEKKRPGLEVIFTNPKPPFKFTPASEEVMQFDVSLTKGDIAKSTFVQFYVEGDFDFPGKKTWRASASLSKFAGAVACELNLGDLLGGMVYHRRITIKAPDQAATYKLGCCIYCQGFSSKIISYDVEVAGEAESEIKPEELPF